MRILLVAAAALAALGCGEGGSPTPAAPPLPAPPPPPAFSLSFVQDSAQVPEGETLAIRVSYEVRELAAPVEVRLDASTGSASEADFEFPEATVSLPAGQALAGEVAVELTALPDLLFTEGTETLSLAFAEPTSPAALGNPLEIRIVEAGAAPCPGVMVIGPPWREEESGREGLPTMLATTLSIGLGAGSTGIRMEFLGPYLDLGVSGRIAQSVSVFGINAWRLRFENGSLVHELDVNWSGESWFEEEAEESLDFAFLGGSCAGEPVASCTSAGCEILR